MVFFYTHSSLKVNSNGMISFETSIGQYDPEPFPIGNNSFWWWFEPKIMIAPYWADVNMFIGGNVSYREILRIGGNKGIFEEADNIIRGEFVNMKYFTSSWMFVATWDEMSFYGGHNASWIVSYQYNPYIYLFYTCRRLKEN